MHMNNIRIENPWLLFVAIPLVIAVLVGFFLLPKAKKSRPKNIISLVLHLVISFTLALAFANIQFKKTSSNVEVYVVVDCSDSEKASVKQIDEVVSQVYTQSSGSNTKVGVVAFGLNQELLVKPGEKFTTVADMFDSTKHPNFLRDGSDIGSAMNYTASLYSEDTVKRMVVISDGQETDGDAVNAVETLISGDNPIHIDTVSLTGNYENEFAILGLNYTDHAYINRDEKVKVSIRSKRAADVTVNLNSNGEVVQSIETTLNRGLNVVSFSLNSTVAGVFEYEVTLSSRGGALDTFSENNVRRFTQDYTDKFNVLFIGDTAEDYNSLVNLDLYTENTTIDSYVDTSVVPYKLEDLVKYDEIVLSNINVLELDDSEEFVTNLRTAVMVHGKSLQTYGTTYTGIDNEEYRYADYYNDMLPVQYQSDEAKAVILLIDVSGSMDTDDRISMAKKGAIAMLDQLNDNDMIGVLTFSDSVKTIQSLTLAKNKTTIIRQINRIKTEGGTTMGPGLKEAGRQLASADVEYRYVITLSDGDPFDPDDCKTNVRRLAGNDIIFSFINITNNSQTSISLLKSLANLGNGNYYYCNNARKLADVMVNSISDLENLEIDQTDSPISFRTADDPVLDNVYTLYNINGFNYCRIKNAATTVLTVTYLQTDLDNNTNTATIPLYAYWRYGNGKVSSFTSSLSSYWTTEFRENGDGKQFFKNSVYQTLPDRNNSHILTLDYKNNGLSTDVFVSPNNNDAGGYIVADIDVDGTKTQYELVFDGVNYSANIPTPKTGKYNATISYYKNKGDSEPADQIDAPIYFDYSKEYDIFTDENNDVMFNVAKKANGNFNEESYTYLVTEEELNSTSFISTMMAFLLTSVVLFLVDIFVRKSDFLRRKGKAANTSSPQA